MAGYDLTPIEVPRVETKYRTIKTKIPVPESLPIFEALRACEPESMLGMPPVVWHKADDFTVYDKWGNRWIDWSSCVLVSNTGHGRPEIKEALKRSSTRPDCQLRFRPRAAGGAVRDSAVNLPDPANYTVFLLSTGSEATENCIKLAKTYALQKHGPAKKYLVSFRNAFHGRTMGAQLAGGMDKQKTWMVDRDPTFVQVPFPDGYKNEDTSFGLFLSTLKEQGMAPGEIAGVMTESYQGVGRTSCPLTTLRGCRTSAASTTSS